MYFVVTYDVSTETRAGRRRLRKVAQECKNYGQRVQKSVFECSINEKRLLELRKQLLDIMDEEEDTIRIYRIHEPHEENIEHHGVGEIIDMDGPLVF